MTFLLASGTNHISLLLLKQHGWILKHSKRLLQRAPISALEVKGFWYINRCMPQNPPSLHQQCQDPGRIAMSHNLNRTKQDLSCAINQNRFLVFCFKQKHTMGMLETIDKVSQRQWLNNYWGQHVHGIHTFDVIDWNECSCFMYQGILVDSSVFESRQRSVCLLTWATYWFEPQVGCSVSPHFLLLFLMRTHNVSLNTQ